jgi:endonuclease/exonuclease/phosphatase family metal-dependent hydrolase
MQYAQAQSPLKDDPCLERISTQQFRIVTYNVHRCRGLDGRISPQRIADILKELNPDIVALQEVLSVDGASREADQARFFSEELKFAYCLGANRRVRGGVYGNVVLSRFPVKHQRNFDISCDARERRGCLQVDLTIGKQLVLHVFNVHLGTSYLERRQQARALVRIINRRALSGPRVLLGDFNEWIRGLASRLLASHLSSADIRAHLQRSRTYPGVLPFLHLDHIYFDGSLRLERLAWLRNRAALVASDHLPLFADFTVSRSEAGCARESAE